MQAIPAKLIALKTLSQVPLSEYADIRPPKDLLDPQQRAGFFKLLRQKPKRRAVKSCSMKCKRTLRFNAAVWLSFPRPLCKPVSLWLSYKDETGENTILVDEQAFSGSSSAMLSGTVSIEAKGYVENLRACCGGVGIDESFCIDELYVRRLDNAPDLKDTEVKNILAS